VKVVRVPAYSPTSVAEHALALILTLNRKTHKAYNRVRDGNFSLERLTGFNIAGKTAGVIGTGKLSSRSHGPRCKICMILRRRRSWKTRCATRLHRSGSRQACLWSARGGVLLRAKKRTRREAGS
jgi:lactate dehydrogenase-like 2-hydroxyacid dehydrogenase